MPEFDYDLFVIGAGSGGVRAARMSAAYGAKTAIAEEYRVGGTCVIRGCVPKKLLVYASRYGDAIEDARGFGWPVDKPDFDWPALRAAKDAELERLEGLYKQTLERYGVELFASRAELADPHTIQLPALDKTVTAKHILVATGGKPLVPPVRGIDQALTSNEIFDLETLPKTIAIIGGGYIGAEFAGIFSGLGVKVTVITLEAQILWEFDKELRDGLAAEYLKRGITLRTNSKVVSVVKDHGGYVLDFDEGDSLHAEIAMNATGRVPNSAGFGLRKAGVELGWNGQVTVNEYSQSSVPHIHAVGDVTHRMALTPVAIREGAALADTLFNDQPTAVDHELVPTAVFSEPEVASVGLREDQARELHRSIRIFKSQFTPMQYSLAGRDQKMLIKLIVAAQTDLVLGCHIMGPGAAEIIQTVAIAIKMGATKAQFDAVMALHPSAAEELVTMKSFTS